MPKHAPISARGSVEPPEFEVAARKTLIRLRGAIRDLIAAAPGEPQRAVDVERSLGVSRMTAWRLHKIACSADPFTVAAHVPWASSVDQVLEAASRHALPGPAISGLESAFADFESLVGEYAGDRETFDSMVGGFAQAESRQSDLRHRRAAYRAQSFIWGGQCDVLAATCILHPNPDNADRLDLLVLQGRYGLRRFRPGAAVEVGGSFVKERVEHAKSTIETLSDDETGVIRAFSSDPLPPLLMREHEPGINRIDTAGTEVGAPSEFTCVFGHFFRSAVPAKGTDIAPHISMGITTKFPTQLAVLSGLIHEPTLGKPSTHDMLIGTLARLPEDLSDHDACRPYQLPLHAKSEYQGRGPETLDDTGVPRFHELLQWAFERLGWDPSEFGAHQLRIPHPPAPSYGVMQFELPR